MEKTCSLCGVIIYGENDMCETCSLMMGGNSELTENFSTPADNLVDQIETNQSYLPPENVPLQFGQPAEETTNFASPMMGAADSISQNQSFSPTNTPPPLPPRRMPPRPVQMQETEYKPSIWYWISELPVFVKIVILVLIFALGFAVVLKGFTKLDVSVVATNPDMEQQKPWFSAWFRSQPTADEIFEKYEKATFAQGKNLSADSFYLTGKAEIIDKHINGAKDLVAYKTPQTPKKENNPPTIQVKPVQKPISIPTIPAMPKPSDFNITFEVSIKKPDKFLMKMTMKPKEGFNQSYVSFPTTGFNGKKGWAFTKTYFNGNSDIQEGKAPSSNYFFKQTNNGVALTFLRSSYTTAEVTGQEDILNRLAYSVKTVGINGKEATIYFDIETGLATKVSENNVDMYILDYTNFDGTMFPSKVVYTSGKEWLMLTMEQIKSNVPLDDAIFERSTY